MWLIIDTVAAMEDIVATIDGLDEELSSDAISIRSLLKSGSLKFENETVHACELVVKCFQDAEIDLMQCQRILAVDPSAPQLSADGANSSEIIVEPVTVPPLPGDCMASVKQKMQQKRTLMEQRAQAFALCLGERMDTGPEDVDPRKFRYCNTVISRYNARTTAPPEFTLITTPAASNEPTNSQSSQPRTLATSSKSNPNPPSTTSRPLPPSNITGQPSLHPPASPLPQIQNARIPRQADPFAAVAAKVANGTNGDIIRPPAAFPPGKRPDGTTTEATPSQQQQANNLQPGLNQEPQQQLGAENEAGKIGAVARFSSKSQQPLANKERTGEQAGQASFSQRNATNVSVPSSSAVVPQSSGDALVQSPATPPEANGANATSVLPPQIEQQQLKSEIPVSPNQQQSSSSNNVPGTSNSSPAAGPPAADPFAGNEPSNSSESGPKSPSDPSQQQLEIQPVVNSSLIKQTDNDTFGSSAVLIQQEEQLEVSVVKQAPLDQPAIDAVPQEQNSAKLPPSTPASGFGSSNPASTVSTVPTTAAAPLSTGIAGSSVEDQKNRVETLRESRRRVSEFKACMARARIKREECKPMVNCCPDSVKCHLRYELSELHDQIHRLELEISEGRQACLEKKKSDDKAVDALDQIDEEDLISDESVVSQQVF